MVLGPGYKWLTTAKVWEQVVGDQWTIMINIKFIIKDNKWRNFYKRKKL